MGRQLSKAFRGTQWPPTPNDISSRSLRLSFWSLVHRSVCKWFLSLWIPQSLTGGLLWTMTWPQWITPRSSLLGRVTLEGDINGAPWLKWSEPWNNTREGRRREVAEGWVYTSAKLKSIDFFSRVVESCYSAEGGQSGRGIPDAGGIRRTVHQKCFGGLGSRVGGCVGGIWRGKLSRWSEGCPGKDGSDTHSEDTKNLTRLVTKKHMH